MALNKDRYFAELEEMFPGLKELDANEIRDLEALLSNKVMKKALAWAYIQRNALSRRLLESNLASEEQRFEAVRVQGQAQGIVMFLENLVDTAAGVQEEPNATGE